jgi:HEAT repeat protein
MTTLKQVETHIQNHDAQSLCRALGDRNAVVRRRAVQGLGELADPAGVACLEKALHTERDEYVIQWAINALRATGDDSAVQALLRLALGPDRKIASWASQGFEVIGSPAAHIARRLLEILHHSEMEALNEFNTEAAWAFEIVMNSLQYTAWSPGKRRQFLERAVQIGAKPPDKFRGELAEMGVFISGIHTVGDLLNGLNHRSPAIRTTAAERLGLAGQAWTIPGLRSRLGKEQKAGGDQAVVIALCRALSRLGDQSALNEYHKQLASPDMAVKSLAARMLAEIQTPYALERIFESLTAGEGGASRGGLLSALERLPPAAIEVARKLGDREDQQSQLVAIELLRRINHPEKFGLLKHLCAGSHEMVQAEALDAIADFDSPEAVMVMEELIGRMPDPRLIRSLASMTQPQAVRLLRRLVPDLTVVRGGIQVDYRNPLKGAWVQIMYESQGMGGSSPVSMAISPRTVSGSEGEFELAILSVPDDRAAISLKVTTGMDEQNQATQSVVCPLKIKPGQVNAIEAHVDTFFARLILLPDLYAQEEGIDVSSESREPRAE